MSSAQVENSSTRRLDFQPLPNPGELLLDSLLCRGLLTLPLPCLGPPENVAQAWSQAVQACSTPTFSTPIWERKQERKPSCTPGSIALMNKFDMMGKMEHQYLSTVGPEPKTNPAPEPAASRPATVLGWCCVQQLRVPVNVPGTPPIGQPGKTRFCHSYCMWPTSPPLAHVEVLKTTYK